MFNKTPRDTEGQENLHESAPVAYRRGRIVRSGMPTSDSGERLLSPTSPHLSLQPDMTRSAPALPRDILEISSETLNVEVERLKKESNSLQTKVFNLQMEIKELEDKKRQLESSKKGSKKKKGKEITIKMDDIRVEQSLSSYDSLDFGSARACDVGGWRCAVLLHANDPESLEALAHEIQMMENLPYHPNVVRHLFHDIVDNQLRIFISQTQGNLHNFIKKRADMVSHSLASPWPRKEIYSMLLDIWRGLNFLHENRIIHRNLKTDTIYVTLGDDGHGISKLAIGDFHVAKKVWKGTMARTGINASSVAVAYTAPEIISSNETGEYSFSADVWSFGMIIYELVTLMRPYEHLGHALPAHRVAAMILEGKRPEVPITAQLPEYRTLIDLYEMCTTFDPARRPSLMQVKTALIDDEDSIKEWFSPDTSASEFEKEKVETVLANWEPRKQVGPKLYASLAEVQVTSDAYPALVRPDCDSMTAELGCKALTSAEQSLQVMPRAFACSVDNFYAYQTYFIKPNIPHVHYVLDSTDQHSLAVISVESKGTLDTEAQTIVYRALVRTVKRDERICVLCPQARASATDRLKALYEKLGVVFKNRPDIKALQPVKDGKKRPSIKSPRNEVSKTEQLKAELIDFEQRQVPSVKCKFGLVYCKKGQKTEEEMLGNSQGSEEFDQFLDLMGEKVVLSGWKGYRGGLSNENELDGKYSIYTEFNQVKIMFHVSTLLKHKENDPQQTQKKRYIGNDLCVIVFRDSDCEPGEFALDPTTFRSQYNHVFVVVQPLRKASPSDPTLYRMAVISKAEASAPHQPLLPFPAVFPADQLRTFLLIKLINGDKDSARAPIFDNRIKQAREDVLRGLIQKYKKKEKKGRKLGM